MLEAGEYSTVREIAAAERTNESYVARILRLTLLAPDIVEAILGDRQSAQMTLTGLMRPFAVGWTEQRKAISAGELLSSSTQAANPDDADL